MHPGLAGAARILLSCIQFDLFLFEVGVLANKSFRQGRRQLICREACPCRRAQSPR